MKILDWNVSEDTGKELGNDRVKIATDDGQELFTVKLGSDGRSLKINTINQVTINGVLYSRWLCLQPTGGNSVEIRTAPMADIRRDD